ncbi:aspartate carbamoyltransferase [Nitrosomonas sp.]|uniref:aspartate carbamoyltransferase n=1 Tax=Nitrosomonas sp. TaxID=42353 RepID=UPI001DEA4A6A|nr:aspartate carbamoyltransferase [Nitrosomonas sp.]MCB1950225.1 aspartate carbamoyltransferase [Nitrosomonas sp.]
MYFLSNILFLMVFAVAPLCAQVLEYEKRLDEVAERGAHAMPFDLEKTMHFFSKTRHGGIQQVIAKDASDTEQIQRIRDHLMEISVEFRQGDFSKPEQIHGEDMPGLAALKSAGPDQISIEYRELPVGAQINYFSRSPQLIEAIHQWFDAQLHDHARHAIPGLQHDHNHGMHHE